MVKIKYQEKDKEFKDDTGNFYTKTKGVASFSISKKASDTYYTDANGNTYKREKYSDSLTLDASLKDGNGNTWGIKTNASS